MSHKAAFSRFLGRDPGRLHMAAHSHHPWPDVSLDAHNLAWHDAASLQDAKWDKVFGEVLPEARAHVAARLRLPDPGTVVFTTNTHELVVRLLSCLPVPRRILTTDAEFHSFSRQVLRLEEEGLATVQRITARPFETFEERFVAAVAAGGHDLVFLSQVLFESGYVMGNLQEIVGAVPDAETFVVVDGYHGFMALPTDWSELADRAFYIAGGYKYAMAGEGACFMHCPPGYGPKPLNTGWFAGFGALEETPHLEVPYPADGMRFAGSTFDPSGLYRFNAVQRWLGEVGLDVAGIHAHVRSLQEQFLAAGVLSPPAAPCYGNFLSMRFPDALAAKRALGGQGVLADTRGEHLRLGLGIYHDPEDVDELVRRVTAAGL